MFWYFLITFAFLIVANMLHAIATSDEVQLSNPRLAVVSLGIALAIAIAACHALNFALK